MKTKVPTTIQLKGSMTAYIGWYQFMATDLSPLNRRMIRDAGIRLVDSIEKTMGVKWTGYIIGEKAYKLPNYQEIVNRIELKINLSKKTNGNTRRKDL